MPYRPPYVDPNAVMLDPPHPATLDPEVLLKQCEFRFGRGGGPGGQNLPTNGVLARHPIPPHVCVAQPAARVTRSCVQTGVSVHARMAPTART